jgi:hypothetical protein
MEAMKAVGAYDDTRFCFLAVVVLSYSLAMCYLHIDTNPETPKYNT